MRSGARIAGLFPLFLAAAATSSILQMTPPIQGLAVTNLRDMFGEIHSGQPHEAIDILEPTGTPVHAVVSGTMRKLFLSKPGRNQIERGEIIGFVGSTGNADPRTPHLHFAIFELGPEKKWWKGKAVNPYPALVAAVKRAR